MKKILASIILLALMAGCQDVTLRGQAMSAAENSAIHAFEAHKRWDCRSECKAYKKLNAEQWRWFVRAAKRDNAWGVELDR